MLACESLKSREKSGASLHQISGQIAYPLSGNVSKLQHHPFHECPDGTARVTGLEVVANYKHSLPMLGECRGQLGCEPALTQSGSAQHEGSALLMLVDQLA